MRWIAPLLAASLVSLLGSRPACAGDPPPTVAPPAPGRPADPKPPVAPASPASTDATAGGELGLYAEWIVHKDAVEPLPGGGLLLVTITSFGGPADAAGLQDGDVILAIDGQTVGAPPGGKALTSLPELRPGASVVLRVRAKGYAIPGLDKDKAIRDVKLVAVTRADLERLRSEWVTKRLGDAEKAGPPKAFREGFSGPRDEYELPIGLVPASGHWAIWAGEGKDAYFIRQGAVVDPWAVAIFAGPGRAVADGKVSARFRLISGREDQAAGVIFRARDAKNYYLVRANGLENNFRLYSMKDGNRWQIASVSVKPPTPNEWHTLEVTFQGPNLRATLDGKDPVEARDELYKSGWVGLWTKADSVTEFDDLAVTPAEPKPAPGK